ncbi:MAG: VWA domain-containing protein [Alphaproteobacteria bacterium]|nr:VWA domain-containing protein [Alphaproteobacteria bacterium]
MFRSKLQQHQPRSEKMAYSKRKFIYGGLATACVALLVYGVADHSSSSLIGYGTQNAQVSHNSFNSIASNVIGWRPNFSGDAAAPGRRMVDWQPNFSDEATTSPDRLSKIVEGQSMDMAAAQSSSVQTRSADIAAQQAVQPGNTPASAPIPAPAEKISKNEVASESTQAIPEPSIAAAPQAAPLSAQLSAITNSASMMGGMDAVTLQQQEFGRDKFKDFEENSIKSVKAEPMSTFSIDVDTASYSFMRSGLSQGVLPPKDAIRIEELINYFDYAYPLPEKKDVPFSTNVMVEPSPWGKGKQLMTIGIKGYDIPADQAPNSNLVFLLDVSGSMNEPAKLPLLKTSIAMLLDHLKPTDTVAMVVYAGAAGTVLEPTKVAEKEKILMALQNLEAGGGTAGAEGIRQAYQLAERNFDKNAVNRVILGTDGDFNVGITNEEELKGFVEREKDKGVFLSVLGFGRGNYNDEMMQILAQNGNGVAAYIDNLNEARKVLVNEATKTLFPIAKDVKIQVEFNPATVAEYRLVGYETRALKTEDFNNDKVDGGDIGAGAEVTAIYELTPVGGTLSVDAPRYGANAQTSSYGADDCKTVKVHADQNDKNSPLIERKICGDFVADDAQKTAKSDAKSASNGELAFVKVRYKLPNENESHLITTPVTATTGEGNATLKTETNWAVAVASFAQILKGSAYTGSMTYDDVIKLAQPGLSNDPFGYRAEFISLVNQAKLADGLQGQPGNGNNIPQPVMPYPYPQGVR